MFDDIPAQVPRRLGKSILPITEGRGFCCCLFCLLVVVM